MACLCLETKELPRFSTKGGDKEETIAYLLDKVKLLSF